jgi:hypothetical protein
MKLVRLQSDDELTESQFTNNLAIAVQLEENARVALKTISLEFEAPDIVIDSTNDTIKYGIGLNSDTNRTVKLNHGSYTVDNIAFLIQGKLNELVQSNDSADATLKLEIGSEWLAETYADPATQTTKIDIVYQVGDIDDSITDADVTGNLQYSTGEFTKAPGTDNNTYNAYIQTNKYICFGGWDVAMAVVPQTVGQPENINQSEWILCLAPDSVSSETDKDDIISESAVAIMRNIEGNYSYLKNGFMNATDTPIEENDIITINKRLNGDDDIEIVYSVVKGTEIIEFVGDDGLENVASAIAYQQHYPILKVGNDTGKISFTSLEFTPSFSCQEVGGVFTQKTATEGVNVIKNINLNAQARYVTLSFFNRQLASLLGYEQVTYTKNGVELTFNSEQDMIQYIFLNDLVVEVPELNLNTYDHTYKQKRNIIMIIPSGDLKNAITTRGLKGYELSYTDIYPTFISLKNKQTTLTYPQLTVRVSSNKKLLKMSGRMSCLLLFKDQEDL